MKSICRLCMLLTAVSCISGSIRAQTDAAGASPAYQPTMTFDVASVRVSSQDPNQPHAVGGSFQANSASLRLENVQMYYMVTMAYGIHLYQVQGLPDWGWTSFNIQAKSDSAADDRLAKLDKGSVTLEQQHMLQALLADRFKLKAHWETREGDVFNLVIAKDGSKMLPAGSLQPTKTEREWMSDSNFKERPLHQENDGKGYDFVGHSCFIGDLVQMLGGQFGKPVINKTGLTGSYDFVVKYRGRFDSDRQPDDNDPMLPLDSAIQNDLGLKVERAKGPIRVLVIDHIEKPTEN
ncbi:MAG TPA: TIGR03435 family protein [Acidobacteriaceae bacterium]